MSKLTALQVKAANNPCRLSDGKGLYFEVTNTGVKRWIYRFVLGGKQGKFTLGRYPDISLASAREMLHEARAKVQEGLNPSQHRKQKKQENIEKQRAEKDKLKNSFANISLDWWKAKSGQWTEDHAKAVLRSLRKDVYPDIGHMPFEDIIPPHILKIIRKIEARGSLEAAKKLLQRINNVFQYAVQTGVITYNPAQDMKGVLQRRKKTAPPTLIGQDLGQLLRDI